MKQILMISALLCLCVGCSLGRSSWNVKMETEQVRIARSVGNKAMRDAIVTAAQSRDWSVEKEREGCISLRLDVRGKHFVCVDVEYGADWFSVRYVDSGNLDYDPSTGAIRGKYIQWVRNLKKDVRLEAMKVR